MKLRDIQAFIPGWNIVYMIREYREFNRQESRLQQVSANLQVRIQRDLKLAQDYATQRDAAKGRGKLDIASDFDKKIMDLALSYIDGRK